MRVHRGGYRAAQRVARPDADDLACNAGLFATADERVPQFVRMPFGQKPLHARGDRVEIGVFCFLKVDKRQNFFHLRGKWYLAKHHVLT